MVLKRGRQGFDTLESDGVDNMTVRIEVYNSFAEGDRVR